MHNNLETISSPALILADFADGNWHATSFAMQFLHEKKFPVSIMQTYQNSNWGRFMMRNLTPHLKKITKYELKQLKNKLLSNYKISSKQVKTLAIKGDLYTILNYKSTITGTYNIVLGTYSSFIDSCNRQNKCLENIINTSINPLFIVTREFDECPNKNILFVGTPNKIPSAELIKQTLKICKETQSGLEILFVLRKNIPKISDDVLEYFSKVFKEIDIKVERISNETKCKGLKNYIKDNKKDLIIIEND